MKLTGWKLWCDEPDCTATFALFGLFGDVQQAASNAGWICPAEGFGRCPSCAQRARQRSERRLHEV